MAHTHVDPHARLCIIAGESSGDRLGAELLTELRHYIPDWHAFGIAGPQLEALGVEVLTPMREIALMGFTEVLKHAPRLLRILNKTVAAILVRRPALVLLIDSPGFTLRLAKRLRRAGYRGRIVLYVSPSVWAHGADRIQFMANHLDLLLCLFPFEPAYYQHTLLQVRYVGSPLLERVQNADPCSYGATLSQSPPHFCGELLGEALPHSCGELLGEALPHTPLGSCTPQPPLIEGEGQVLDPEERLAMASPELSCSVLDILPQGHPLVGLFPGSRRQEIRAHLPKMLASARMLLLAYPKLRFALSCNQEDMEELISSLICGIEDPLQLGKTLFLVDKAYTFPMMKRCHAAIAKSGTVTLELALLRVPTVVIYAVSLVNALIIHYCLRIRLPYYSIANILGQYAEDLRVGRVPYMHPDSPRDSVQAPTIHPLNLKQLSITPFPELLARDFQPERIAQALGPLLTDGPQRQACLLGCEKIEGVLRTERPASKLAAEAIVQLLSRDEV